MKRFPGPAGALIAALLLVGCSPTDPMTGRPGSDLPPGPLQPVPTDSAPPVPTCKELEVGRGTSRSAADADFVDLTFTNRTDAECVVHGYPTLTMRDAGGRAMGDSAGLSSNGAARYIVLEPGAEAVATVRYPKSEPCTSGSARIEVLIPGAARRDYVPESHPLCPGWTVTSIGRPFR